MSGKADGGGLARLRRALGRSSSKLASGISDLFNKRKLDQKALEELQERIVDTNGK